MWCADTSTLFWADIFGCAVYGLDLAGAVRSWELDTRVGAIALGHRGELVLGLKSGIDALDLETGLRRPLASPEAHREDNRFNDCTVDAAGRLWIGSLDDTGIAGRGSVYRVEPDGTASAMVEGVGLSNGIGFSPDQRHLYLTDTAARTITCYEHDPGSGLLGRRRLFASDVDCLPDGLAVDTEGCVWSAKWGGGRVVRYSPDGAVDRSVELPVECPTSIAFGGPGLDRLFVTTASIEVESADELSRGAGQVLVCDGLGATGLEAHRFEHDRSPLPESGGLARG